MKRITWLFLILILLFSASLYADRQTDLSSQWHKSGKDVLRGFTNMYNPHVVYESKSEYPFKMWFFGWASGDGNP